MKATQQPGARAGGRARPNPRDPRLDRVEWIAAAREALIAGGIDRVKVLPLAQALGVTTGSFYWHFKDRPDLLAALLADWEDSNSRAFHVAVETSPDPHVAFEQLINVWVREEAFDPNYDSAVRDWSRNAPDVEAVVHRVDDTRIELIHQIFQRMADPEPDALVRARIIYYHQVGYYAMRIKQDPAERATLHPTYLRLLKGR